MNRRSESVPAGSSLRDRIRETTTQAILAAAEEVFADQGLHAAHMGDIAARAGVAVGTLYNHFKDREALLAGLLVARKAELLARLDQELREPRSFRDKLRVLLSAMLANTQAHRKLFHILWQGEVGRYQETFPSACHKPADMLREILARVDKVMRQGIREGELRSDLRDLAPALFMGMVRSMAVRAFVLEADVDFVGETDRLLSFFLEGAGA
jgi:AcrR family transcriptional regulator